MATSLANGLGGEAGFGENGLPRTDDGSSGFIDLSPVLPAGLNFYGFVFTGLWVNNNGSVSFGAPMSAFTPSAITGASANPLITPFWGDVDTRSGSVAATPGGTSAGSNRVWYDLDAADGIFTVTWDDVGYFNRKTDRMNAFQLRLHEVGGNGDFDIEFRYEAMTWTTGDFSGGSGGLGGTVARAGYSSGNGVDYLELPQSGDQAGMLGLPGATNGGDPGSFVFAIRNGAVQARISVGDARIEEGDGASPGFVVVPVTLSAPAEGPVVVRYATQNGSAAAGQDYVAQRGSVVFAPGTAAQEIRIQIAGDRRVEADETFALRLVSATGAAIADARGLVTIVNDDGLAVADATAAEGPAGAPGSLVFTVRLLSAMDAPVTVDWATADGSATAGLDYTAAGGSLTFAPGETEKQVTVGLVGDSVVDGDETVALVLSNALGAPVARATATGTIVDDDTILVDDVSIAEGTGTMPGIATVTLRLAGPSDQAVTVDYATEDGSALAGADYTATSGTATIAAGQTSTSFTIPVLRDAAVEGPESFVIRLSNATGASIADATAEVTVRDDDGFSVTDVAVLEGSGGGTSMVFTVTLASAASGTVTVDYATADGTALAGLDYTATSGTLTFGAGQTSRTFTVPVAADTEGNDGATAATVTVTLTASATPVTLDWATADGTASAGEDYTAAAGSLTFAPGETSQTISIAIAPDTVWEANEAFRIQLSNAVGAPLVGASGSVTIANDDARDAPEIDILDARQTEGTGGAAVMRFTLGLSYAVGSAVTLDYATADGTALAGTDYAATAGTLTIAAGARAAVIEVPLLADALLEGDEAFTLALSNPGGGASLGRAAATGTLIDDDTRLDIAAADALLPEGDSGSTAFAFTVTRSGDLGIAHAVRWMVVPDGAPGGAARAADFAGGVLPSGV
ncbi:MAG: hypothetical protein MUF53_13095, partial [Gemmatimonadaceae bacterium]|nr:hypothetical protein [Gemmatimonadaceae bacterium]